MPAAGNIILGLDPGYAAMGYGVIAIKKKELSYIACDTITTSAGLPLGQRLLTIADALKEIIKKYKPDLVSVEKIFFFKNAKTVIEVAQARGVVLVEVARYGLPLIEYTPMEIKQNLTSYGHASKQQVERMVKVLLRNSRLPAKDDAIDALAVAICAAAHRRFIPTPAAENLKTAI